MLQRNVQIGYDESYNKADNWYIKLYNLMCPSIFPFLKVAIIKPRGKCYKQYVSTLFINIYKRHILFTWILKLGNSKNIR